jgi:predicted molibdopterin-dependent oxidoreductase YjgC
MSVEDTDLRVRNHPILGALPDVPLITFCFDGTDIRARDGETVAAALLAAGVRVFRTMPRSGEERGGFCMVGRCSDCLMTVDGMLNVQVCITPVREGMRVKTQRGFGSWDDAGPQLAAEEIS